MKRHSVLLGIVVAAIPCSTLPAQEKPAIQPNATVLSILQSNAGKAVELHLRSGEKIGGRVGQVTDNIVYLSHLAGAEFFDAFVGMVLLGVYLIVDGLLGFGLNLGPFVFLLYLVALAAGVLILMGK